MKLNELRHTYTVDIELMEEILGTACADANIHETYIASKAPDAMSTAEEVAALGVEEVVENAMTIFARTPEGKPALFDYQVRGFFKEACGFVKKMGSSTDSAKIKAHKKTIDGLVTIEQRMIPFEGFDKVGNCQRPLRAQTAQGERVALANSETIPAGAKLHFTVELFDKAVEGALDEWLQYGFWHGLGQWRNSGKGKFVYKLTRDADGKVIGDNTHLKK